MNNSFYGARTLGLAAVLVAAGIGNPNAATVADAYTAFVGAKTAWHLASTASISCSDEKTMAIKPADAATYGQRGRPAALHRGRAEDGRAGQSVVVAGLLLGPPAADRNRTAQARLSHRLHLGRRDIEARQEMGRLVRVSHGKAWSVQEAGIYRHEPRRRIRIHLGHRASRQGFLHLCRQSRRQSRNLREARRPGQCRRAAAARLRQHRSHLR